MAWLLPSELTLWQRLPAADRRHAIGVARAVAVELGPQATRPVVAAALLHDVGKLASSLGTLGRVAATIAGARTGPSSRFGRYRRHDELGAAMLTEAGSDPLAIAWALEHHGRVATSVAPSIAAALKAADND